MPAIAKIVERGGLEPPRAPHFGVASDRYEVNDIIGGTKLLHKMLLAPSTLRIRGT